MEAKITSSQPLVEIQLLGRFRVKIDGIAVEEKRWTRNSAKSLVKLLAIKPFHTLHREQVMDLLWMEQTPETALNNLNKAIYGARRAFEPDLTKGPASRFILTQKNQIVLDSPGGLRIDLDEFERLAGIALRNDDLETGRKALEIYLGDLLVEDIYDDWIYARRESMRLLYRKTAAKTAGLYAAENNRPASIEILKKLACDDASDEYVNRLLMRQYAETGSKYQALKQFEQCRAALRALGIEPEPETVRLERKIRRGEILPVEPALPPVRPTAPAIVTAPRITPLTFQNGVITSAKFAAGGKTAVLTADWSGAVLGLYALDLASGEIRSLGIEQAEVLAVSPAGDLAVIRNPEPMGFYNIGTLARLPAEGGPAVEILRGVHWADWHPAKSRDSARPEKDALAVVRDFNGKNRLEFPIGQAICETEGWIGSPRFSPDGRKIAFIEHPFLGDDRGFVAVCDLENGDEKRVLTANDVSMQGLAWSNDEIWFTSGDRGSGREIKAVGPGGEVRTLYRATGNLKLHDVSANSRALVTDDKTRVRAVVRRAVDDAERDLSWHDWTLPRALTDDGETLLFEEGGASGGGQYNAYTRKTDGSAVKKLGDGSALALSPDGKHALLRFHGPRNHLALTRLDTGETKPLATDPANPLHYDVYACFFPDGKRILFAAKDADGRTGVYIQNIDGGKPVRFRTAGPGVVLLSGNPISPDGRFFVLTDAENGLALYRAAGGAATRLENLENFWLVRWADDGESLFVWQRKGIPAIVYKYDPASGEKNEWLILKPQDASGGSQIGSIKLTPDGKNYAYSYVHESSDLFLMGFI